MLLRCVFLLLGWLTSGQAAWAATVTVPPLSARVTDITGTLSPDQTAHLEAKLAAFETRKGAQVALLLLPTSGDDTIEQFGIRVMDAWKIGRKGVDDGAILIVAKDDRRLRIEVGYGLEGALNDATAKRIIDEVVVPRFKAGDFAEGIDAGIDRIIAVIEGEQLPVPVAGALATSEGEEVAPGLLVGGLAAMAIGGAALRFFLGNLLGAAIVGVMASVAGWVFTATLSGALAGFAIGFFVAIFGLDLLLSGVFGGGGRSGGGFSGGGGSGGGGGASGRW